MQEKIKWGIIGLGKIANLFAHDLMKSSDVELIGAASKSKQRAETFAEKYGVSKTYNSYVDLAKDPKIDVIYIATPHSFHYEHALMCLKNNKHVLCEKPMCLEVWQVEKLIAEARERKRFLMEGMWTRFIPVTEKLLELIEQKTIGNIFSIKADFGFKTDIVMKGRLFEKELGGGSLMDIGIYPVYLSLLLLGAPDEIMAMARITPSGVDSYCSMLFGYENSAKAMLESTLEANTPTEAYIYGDKGQIKIEKRFHHSEKLIVSAEGQQDRAIEIKYSGNGFYNEIAEVNHCIRNNHIESKKLPHKMSLELIEVIDRVRNKIGLSYVK